MKQAKMLNRSFWAGFCVCALLATIVQDWFGLEAYVQMLQENWIHVHWAIWIPPLLFFVWWQSKQLKVAKDNDNSNS